MQRISNITSYRLGWHVFDGRTVPHTDLAFHYQGEYYGARESAHMSRLEIEEAEERFLERRHKR